MCDPRPALPSLILFDIGGVVVHSPLVAINVYEKKLGLPPNYLNVAIRFRGTGGAFQRFERGEVDLWSFYDAFGRELSDAVKNNEWYTAWCQQSGREVPGNLPSELQIDGRDLFGEMMRQSSKTNPIVVDAIKHLRASGKFRIAALTNNFAPPTSVPSLAGSPSSSSTSSTISPPSLEDELKHLGVSPSSSQYIKSLFDSGAYYESSLLGARKPEPKIYQHVLQAEGLADSPGRVLFLDDIGPNLKAARKLGINTIKVGLTSQLEAIEELEKWTRMSLIDGEVRKSEKEKLKGLREKSGSGKDTEGAKL